MHIESLHPWQPISLATAELSRRANNLNFSRSRSRGRLE
ncbi:hypothetical protein MTBBW1_2870004 [Desulfamplus magnetovallimortis]|uniref:Uncharacterized protein n=1 Tax=Desulfamplus magnetovallimortis TaxID=1246637 RepID=A0A1W1HFQ5_9BACT|nr:hypothetical protein MTBBW1_2870004 [Desulfamplus magnetovallimortis]